MDEPRDDAAPKPDADPAPDLSESLHRLGASGRAGLGAALDAAKALRALISADLSLARSAFGHSLAFIGVAIAAGGSTWMLLMATLTALLHDTLHWPWTLALATCALLSLMITAFGVWRAVHYFEHTRLQATRRQLARLGIGELSDFMPSADSHESAREAAERVASTGKGPPVKNGQGIDITPP